MSVPTPNIFRCFCMSSMLCPHSRPIIVIPVFPRIPSICPAPRGLNRGVTLPGSSAGPTATPAPSWTGAPHPPHHSLSRLASRCSTSLPTALLQSLTPLQIYRTHFTNRCYQIFSIFCADSHFLFLRVLFWIPCISRRPLVPVCLWPAARSRVHRARRRRYGRRGGRPDTRGPRQWCASTAPGPLSTHGGFYPVIGKEPANVCCVSFRWVSLLLLLF